VVGDGGGSSKSFDPTDGVEVLSFDSSSNGASGAIVEGLPPTAGGVLVSAVGGAKSLMEISSIAPSLSTRKLNIPKAMSKPPVTVETAPAVPEVGSTMVTAGVRPVVLGDPVSMMVNLAMSTSGSNGFVSMMASTAMPTVALMVEFMSILALVSMMVSTAMPTMVSMVVSMSILALVGEGAGESVDPDPIVPTVGAN
jgi:hypothetical protein